jgi:hypothetical protein
MKLPRNAFLHPLSYTGQPQAESQKIQTENLLDTSSWGMVKCVTGFKGDALTRLAQELASEMSVAA